MIGKAMQEPLKLSLFPGQNNKSKNNIVGRSMEEISAILKDLKDAGMAVPIRPPIISPFNTSFWHLQKSDRSWRMKVATTYSVKQ